ncbi:MAG: two-component system C4-dicarboxylate transport sensor histidine kinase DctB [Burkholderiaceae bacterium]|jgi:two-component system C4-dicarboxylate transport sensor histidine kinase DctB
MKALSNRRRLLLAVAGVLLIVGLTYWTSARMIRSEIDRQSERQLQVIALDLQSMLEKFETLPFSLSVHPDMATALLQPANAATILRVSQTLHTVQQQARVAAIYLMDSQGLTIAASNWNEPQNYIGRNFGFRPYFRDAINGGAGRFYGIGSTTSEPGYFIAQPVYANGQEAPGQTPLGVLAVKISLNEFERTWRTSEEPIVLADRDGVVFLGNRPAWQYHSLASIDVAAREKIMATLQYVGKDITPISSLPAASRKDYDASVMRPVGRLGWQLRLFPAQSRITRAALLWSGAMTLLLFSVMLSLWARHQRRRRLEERHASRQALQQAAEELDRQIALRTDELLQANRDLGDKYARLEHAQGLLRTTQDELVQAGKLAMLGQMAAGVTHELNQPLAAIRAFADNAVTFLERGQPGQASANLAHISAASARMGVIIGQLKAFARKSHGNVAVVELTPSVHASALLLQAECDRLGVVLQIDIAEPLQILGDAVRTEQVLINLLRNALDAVEEAVQRRVALSVVRDGDHALICVRDSGPGIPDEVAAQLFAPFFTTKPSGKGLGLGLAISSSIVQAMRGQLTARNLPDGGAEFQLRLPLYSPIAKS